MKKGVLTRLPGSAEPQDGMCGALLRRSQLKHGCKRYCVRSPMTTATRCRIHGGATPKGAASVHFIHGEYSQALKGAGGLQATFHEVAKGRVALRENIALADLHVVQALGQLGDGVGLKNWSEAVGLYNEMQAANTAGDQARVVTAIGSLGRVLYAGKRSMEAWREVALANDHKRKLVQTESKRVMTTMISAATAVALAQALLHAVRDVEDDPRKVTEIGRRFDRMTATLTQVAG